MSAGVGRHVADLAEALARRGHEVHLICSQERSDAALLGRLQAIGNVAWRALPMRREPHWRDVAVLLSVAGYLRRRGPFDVIHGHSSKGGGYARIVRPFSRARCIYTPHAFWTLSPELTGPKHLFYTLLERSLSLATDTIICSSDLERQHALRLGLPPRALATIPIGIASPPERRDANATVPWNADGGVLTVGFVGRLVGQKAPEILVKAAAIVKEHGRRTVRFVMIGDGPLRADVQGLVAQLGLADTVSLLGDRPAAPLIAAFDVLAVPSRYEGFPYVLLEALQAGVPVIITPVGGAAEAIEDGRNGFLIPHEDPGALAERILRLADDGDLLKSLKANAKAGAARFGLDRMVDSVLRVYAPPGR